MFTRLGKTATVKIYGIPACCHKPTAAGVEQQSAPRRSYDLS